MIDKNWKCLRCGDCCKYVAGSEEWTYATLTGAQIEAIEAKMQPVERGCKACIVVDGQSVCLNQFLFGIEAKPDGCVKFTHRCKMTQKVKQLIKNRKSMTT